MFELITFLGYLKDMDIKKEVNNPVKNIYKKLKAEFEATMKRGKCRLQIYYLNP
jgi:hypothetical protein